MDQRQRWQALQHHLKASRAALDAGDRPAALQHANAALAIDPAFLAAQTLRERILADGPVRLSASLPPRPDPAPATAAAPLPEPMAPPSVVPVISPTGAPVVRPSAAPDVPPSASSVPPAMPSGSRHYSPEGLAQFEARARQRRIDRRVRAAQDSIAARQLSDAREAIDEIRELSPTHPELAALVSGVDAAEHPAPAAHRAPAFGPWLAAAAVFAGLLLAAPWIQRTGVPRPSVSTARVEVAVTQPDVAVSTAGPDAATLGAADDPRTMARELPETPAPAPVDNAVAPSSNAQVRDSSTRSVPTAALAPAASTLVRSAAEPPRPPVETSARTTAIDLPTAPPVAAVVPAAMPDARSDLPSPLPPPVSRDLAAASLPSPLPAPRFDPPAPAYASRPVPVVPRPDDEQLVKDVLQRYRSAYEGLDARRAQAVWPGVNETALQRAFQGLESQNLTFNDCDVQLRGAAASATCRGTMTYVPKVGSREPHVEPRVWNFTLQKAGDDWHIQNARAER